MFFLLVCKHDCFSHLRKSANDASCFSSNVLGVNFIFSSQIFQEATTACVSGFSVLVPTSTLIGKSSSQLKQLSPKIWRILSQRSELKAMLISPV